MSHLQGFHEALFPIAVSFGATGGPERRNEIVQLTSGREQRNARFLASRRRYDAGTGVRSIDDLYEVMEFFEARRGSLHGFRFRDPFDMNSRQPGRAVTAFDQQIGIGNGSSREFTLVKSYGEGGDRYVRPIAKPRAETVRVAVGGIEMVTSVDFSVEATTGLVTFAPEATPGDGEPVTAGYEFDVPVRFDMDHLSVSLAAFKAGQIPTIPLVEIVP